MTGLQQQATAPPGAYSSSHIYQLNLLSSAAGSFFIAFLSFLSFFIYTLLSFIQFLRHFSFSFIRLTCLLFLLYLFF